MSFAGTRILTGIMVVGTLVASLPQVADAQGCNGGSVANGGVQTFSYSLDSSQVAQFTLDSTASDLSMLVVDDQSNIACETSLPNSGHQVCSWMPVAGAVYTVQVLRPATQAAIDAANAAQAAPTASNSAASASASTASNASIWSGWTNSGSGSSSSDSSASTASSGLGGVVSSASANTSAPAADTVTEVVAPGPEAGLGGATEAFNLCSLSVN